MEINIGRLKPDFNKHNLFNYEPEPESMERIESTEVPRPEINEEKLSIAPQEGYSDTNAVEDEGVATDE